MAREDVRVVVVDDEPEVAATLEALLDLDGYRVRVAHNAAAALDLVAEFEPHCVLLDLGLPDVDGCTLARELRARCGPDLVLVAVTGRSRDAERSAAESAGVDFVLGKPLDTAALRQMLPPIA